MIEISRALVRHVRAVLRKSAPMGMGRNHRPPLLLQAGRDGLRLRSQQLDVAVEYHLPGVLSPENFALPGEALDDFEGRKEEELVSLENAGKDAVLVRWEDGGVPQAREYAAFNQEKSAPFPEEPRKLSPIDSGILKALEDAAQTAAKDGVRFALQKLQLRGSTGDIIATDGKQLLIQGNFALPWKEEILIPAVGISGCRELPQDAPVSIGKSDKFVCLRIGSWKFHLAIDQEGRFPKAQDVIPRATGNVTTCQLSVEDGAFLLKVLPRLTVTEKEHWKERIAKKIDNKIEAITATNPGLLERIQRQAHQRALGSLGLAEIQAELDTIASQTKELEKREKRAHCTMLAALRRVPIEEIEEPYYVGERLEVSQAIQKREAIHEEELLAENERGREILRLRREKDNLLDTVWLAASPQQIKDLWRKVVELLGDEQTHLEKEALAIGSNGTGA